MTDARDLIQSAQCTIRLEIEAVEGLLAHIDTDFVSACEMILASKGRVVVVGMGKSGTSAKRSQQPWRAPARLRFSCTRPKPVTATWA
jgi:arabinose-5-phosphate isomerase